MRRTRLVVGPTLAVLAALIVACFSERRDPTGIGDVECSVALPSPAPNQVIVAMRDFAFHPAEVQVAPGTTVTWFNCEPSGTEAHTATANGGAWASPLLNSAGGTYSRVFGSAGRFDYHCGPHPFMQGSVVVGG